MRTAAFPYVRSVLAAAQQLGQRRERATTLPAGPAVPVVVMCTMTSTVAIIVPAVLVSVILMVVTLVPVAAPILTGPLILTNTAAGAFDDLIQIATIQPDTTTIRAVTDLHSGAFGQRQSSLHPPGISPQPPHPRLVTSSTRTVLPRQPNG